MWVNILSHEYMHTASHDDLTGWEGFRRQNPLEFASGVSWLDKGCALPGKFAVTEMKVTGRRDEY